MRYYLSSYELGAAAKYLRELAPNGALVYIPNARDIPNFDSKSHLERTKKDIRALKALSLKVDLLDLRDYFDDKVGLYKKVRNIRAVFISGGNAFVLRQAMKISALDEILEEFYESDNFLYSGYSAAGCVLAPSLKGYELVDPVQAPYPELRDVIWDGLGHVEFRFVPHWRSDHPEAADVEKVFLYCAQNDIPYRAIRDGEALLTDHLRQFVLVGSATGFI